MPEMQCYNITYARRIFALQYETPPMLEIVRCRPETERAQNESAEAVDGFGDLPATHNSGDARIAAPARSAGALSRVAQERRR